MEQRPLIDALDGDLLRSQGARALEFIASYWERMPAMRVMSGAAPGEVKAKLPAHAPEGGAGSDAAKNEWDAIFRDLESIVVPGLTHWQHPHFYAFFPANVSAPAVVGELLAAGLGAQGMLWLTSPACTEVETRVLDWLGEAIGLPASFLSSSPGGGGVIQGTASEAAVAAIVASRHRARVAIRARRGAEAARRAHFTVYASAQAHSSIVKAAMVTGLAESPDDREHLRLIDVDPATYAMEPAALEAALREDLAAGKTPMFVCATLGTTGSTAIDPIGAIAATIERAFAAHADAGRPWLHVDAAHAGACLICPELRWMSKGIEHADSVCFNPHKWLLTNFDCDCFWTRDRQSLTGSMSITPEYLRNRASASGEVFDYRDWHVPLGRRFRALKLWLVMRHYGLERLRSYVREHNRLAAWLEERVRGDARWEIAAPRTMNLVCFRAALRGMSVAEADAKSREIMERLNASGRAYLTQTSLPDRTGQGRYTIRVCIGSVSTREEHVRELWSWIAAEADAVLGTA